MYLGIDAGTSGVKAVLLDEAGALLAEGTASLTVARPAAGWSEQNPEDWWQAVSDAVSQLRQKQPAGLAAVQAIGLSGQMHGLVGLDASDQPLRPAILWNDTRNGAEAEELDRDPLFRSIGGNAVMPGFTAPKALWMARNEPDLFARLKTVLLPKDYIRLRMSGEKWTDMSDASGTLWLDVANRCWSDKLLGACDLAVNAMPELAEGSQPAGQLSGKIANLWGIDGQPLIAAGGGDNAAAACGLGVVRPGQGFVSLGTSGVIFKVTRQFAPAADSGAHAFCHAVPGIWHQMSVMLAATDCLNWLSEITGQPVASLIAQMDSQPACASGLYFHPYLSGERTPHNDANARAGFFGLARQHGLAQMVRAVVEGVAFGLADGADVLAAAGGKPDHLLVTGGGARSPAWLDNVAAAIGMPLLVPEKGDFGAALGAGRLAMLAAGGPAADILVQPPISTEIMPDPALADLFGEARAKWRSVYHSLKSGESA